MNSCIKQKQKKKKKNRNRFTETENKLTVTEVEMWQGGIHQEVGIDIQHYM